MIGKFLSVDPKGKELTSYSPYSFASNRPIDGVDYLGLSWIPVIDKNSNVTGFKWTDSAPDPANNIFAQAVHFYDYGAFNPNNPKVNRKQMGTAVVTVYGDNMNDIHYFKGTTYPADIENHATLKGGIHWAVLGFHKNQYPALRLYDGLKAPVMNDFNPNSDSPFTDGAGGVNIHSAWPLPWDDVYFEGNKDNPVTGYNSSGNSPMSEGCLLIDPARYEEFIDIFRHSKYGATMNKIFTSFPFGFKDAKYGTKGSKLWDIDYPKVGVGVYRDNPLILKDEEKINKTGKKGREFKISPKYEFPKKSD